MRWPHVISSMNIFLSLIHCFAKYIFSYIDFIYSPLITTNDRLIRGNPDLEVNAADSSG